MVLTVPGLNSPNGLHSGSVHGLRLEQGWPVAVGHGVPPLEAFTRVVYPVTRCTASPPHCSEQFSSNSQFTGPIVAGATLGCVLSLRTTMGPGLLLLGPGLLWPGLDQ